MCLVRSFRDGKKKKKWAHIKELTGPVDALVEGALAVHEQSDDRVHDVLLVDGRERLAKA